MKTDGSKGDTKGAPAKQSAGMALKTFLESKRASFEDLLPTKKAADRFMRILISLPIMSPAILGCTHESIIKAAILCARDGLEPDGRHAALVPFKNKKAGTVEATYMPMVHGWIRKAFETGEFRAVTAHDVHEKDYFDYAYGLNEHLDHKPAEGDRGEVTKFYALYKLQNGGQDFIVMTVADVHQWAKDHAKNAYDAQDSLYHTDFTAWALKTVVKRVLHFAPTSIQLSDEDDNGMRNVTPSPSFDLSGAREKAEDAEPVTIPPEDAAATVKRFELQTEREPGQE